MATYSLGERIFPTKKAAKDHFKAILARNSQDNVPLTGQDSDDVKTLITVGRHPNSVAKIGSGIDHVFIRRNDFGTRGFWLSRTDGTQVDFSYLTAIDGAPSVEKEVKAALRREIEDQITDFRASTTTSTCELCGAAFGGSDETHVDHAEPTFDALAKQFVDHVGGWGQLPVRCIGVSGRYLDTPDQSADWRAFHQETARLRVTHKACNLSRPRTGELAR